MWRRNEYGVTLRLVRWLNSIQASKHHSHTNTFELERARALHCMCEQMKLIWRDFSKNWVNTIFIFEKKTYESMNKAKNWIESGTQLTKRKCVWVENENAQFK